MHSHGRGHTETKIESIKGKAFDIILIKRLLKFARKYWGMFLISLILILLASAAQLYRPYLFKEGIDTYIKGADSGIFTAIEANKGILSLAITYLVMIFAELVLGYGKTMVLNYAAKRIIFNIRNKLFAHVQKLPLSYFDKNPVGTIVTRITNDTMAVNEMFANVLVGFIQNIFLMLGIFVVMFMVNTSLALISLIVFPVIAVATIIFRNKIRTIFREIRSKLAEVNAFISEHIQGIRIIQTFNMEIKKLKEFDKINTGYYKALKKRIIAFGVFRPIMVFTKSLALSILLWYGGLNILAGDLEFGTLYLFINYMNLFFQPLRMLAEQFNTMQSAMAASEKIFLLLDTPTENEPIDSKVIENPLGRIEFKNVWFAYSRGDYVLKDVSFTIEPGESVAFVGATGAGKTSIISLLCGFYEYQKGQILVDGIDIKEMKKQDLRKHIGLVLQDVFLVAGDVTTNIRLYNENISEDKVREAAEFVSAGDLIEALPDGYKTRLYMGGTTLSAGERQLISFARAIVNDPKILVMDEATSNIDTQTEKLIQSSLTKIMKGRTTISIAHRLSTIQQSDKIIVLHKGRIREMGDHQELLSNGGIYFDLYKLQYSG